jgi:hypothetical protein
MPVLGVDEQRPRGRFNLRVDVGHYPFTAVDVEISVWICKVVLYVDDLQGRLGVVVHCVSLLSAGRYS